MEHVTSSRNVITFKPTSIRLKEKSNSINRDLLIWLFFLVILPLIFFAVYFIAKSQNSSSHIRFSFNQLKNFESKDTLVDDTNYLGKKNPIETPQSNLINQNSLKYKGYFDYKKTRPLTKITLSKYSRALCNDGSIASYYLRLSDTKSKEWLIVVEGGYFCYDSTTCEQRFLNSHNFTSSNSYKSYEYGEGILSAAYDENKHWSDVNVVNIPYCSSDLWIGNKLKENSNGSFNFLGQEILNNVFTDLLNEYGMKDSELVILAGISSGGIGTLLNANRLKDKLELAAPNAKLKTIIDSSWLTELPYSYLCNYLEPENADECIINKIFVNSIKFWQANLPSECKQMKNIWDCFLPYKLIPKLQVPVFIVQSLFDETLILEQFRTMSSQNSASNGYFKKTLQKANLKLRNSLEKISQPNGYFIPACTTHMILTRKDFKHFKIGDIQLEDAIFCWSRNSQSNECFNKNRIENCQWPSCKGSTCPQIKHPDNSNIGVSPLEYFGYFGLVNYESLTRKLRMRLSSIKSLNEYNNVMEKLMQII